LIRGKGIPPPFAKADAYLELTISDTGVGIHPDIVEQVFDPFFTTKKIGDGTGLGLSVVHGIVESHRGNISLESKENEGTSFYLLFPVIKQNASDDISTTDTDYQGGQHILIAEDEASLAKLYKTTLQASGYQVTTAGNWAEALSLFLANPDKFDLVFSDQIMPEMTGADLSREVLKLRPEKPIILATGYDILESKAKTTLSGITHYLQKPIKLDLLKRLVKEIFTVESDGTGSP